MVLLAAQVTGLLILLAIINQVTVNTVFHISHRVSGKPDIGVWLYALFFFPGTLIHELSHWSVARILRVHTAEMHLLPRLAEGYLTLGYVKIHKTDIVRSFFIAGAPFFIGLTLLISMMHFYFQPLIAIPYSLGSITEIVKNELTKPVTWLMLYAVVTIAHALFPSRADRNEMILGPIVLVGTGVIFWLLKDAIVPSLMNNVMIEALLGLLRITLLGVLGANIILLLTLSFLRHGIEKIF